MLVSKILVTIVGLAAIAFVAWFFFGKRQGVRIGASGTGLQEALITVKGGYTPDVILVEAGRPVRLQFVRQETAACSEMVVFPDFGKSAKLPTGQAVDIQFTTEKPGEYEFACQMGMFRGRLIVQ